MTLNENVLSDALCAFATGEGCTEYAATEALRARLRVSEYDARVVLHGLTRSGRLEQRLHPENGFVTYWRPSGKAAHRLAAKRVIAARKATDLPIYARSMQTPLHPTSARARRAMEYANCR